jgi:DNA polymerase-3 subunit epsilon
VTWFDGGRWAAFDTESTAPDPAEARLVTACVAFVGGGQPTEVVSWVVDAGVEVPDEAAAIHGYTTERVRAEGKPIGDVLPEIVGYLAGAVTADLPLVAYNAPYDATLLNAETVRLGLDPFADVLARAVVYDPLCIDRHVDRFRKGSRKLEDTCTHYGLTLDGAHNAEADALAAARVLYRIGQRTQMTPNQLRRLYADRRRPDELVNAFTTLGKLNPTGLHLGQVGWYAEQAESLAQYFRRLSNEKAHEADEAADRDEFNLAADLKAEAKALLDKADAVNTVWPLQPLAVAS